jgi:hypothetical protein
MKTALCLLVTLFVCNLPFGVFASGFASDTNGIKEFPGFMYDHNVGKLIRSITTQIEGVDEFEVILKTKRLKSEDIRLLVEARYIRIISHMDELQSVLKVPPPYPDPKYASILYALKTAFQANSNFDVSIDAAGTEKGDLEYWKKRIKTIKSALRLCSEFRFMPVENNTKPQQDENKSSTMDKNTQITDQRNGVYWYASFLIALMIGIFFLCRK